QRIRKVRADETRAAGDQHRIGRPRRPAAGDAYLAPHRLRPPLAQEPGEELLAPVHVAHAHVVVADVELPSLLDGHVRRKIVEAIPVEPVRRRIERVEKPPGLPGLVMAPGRVTRLGDPDLGVLAVASEQLPRLGDVAGPAAPGARLRIPRTRKAV